jgi:hypothetical protein
MIPNKNPVKSILYRRRAIGTVQKYKKRNAIKKSVPLFYARTQKGARRMSIKTELQKTGRGKHITGHDLTAPERYAPDTRHMVILNIIKDYAGHKPGGRVRLFLTDEGYNETVQADECGNIKIIRHATVRMGELEQDAQEREQ